MDGNFHRIKTPKYDEFTFLVLSQESTDRVLDLIKKYNERLAEITIHRDKLRDKVVALEKLKCNKVQRLDKDGNPMIDPKTSLPLLDEIMPPDAYTGEPMTKQQRDLLIDQVCGHADGCIDKIKNIKKQ